MYYFHIPWDIYHEIVLKFEDAQKPNRLHYVIVCIQIISFPTIIDKQLFKNCKYQTIMLLFIFLDDLITSYRNLKLNSIALTYKLILINILTYDVHLH